MTTHRFQTYEGNTIALPFELHREGVKGVWDVSGATQIALEVTSPSDADMTPILADENHADADWAAGLVVVVITGSNVTALLGTYRYSLTVTISGQVITVATGLIEVLDRPGFTPA